MSEQTQKDSVNVGTIGVVDDIDQLKPQAEKTSKSNILSGLKRPVSPFKFQQKKKI